MYDRLIAIDWSQLLIPDSSVAEMMLRGTLVYLGLFAILRVFRRPAGQLSIADVLLITVLADAAQNAMGDGYESVSSGFVLIGTIVFWDRLIDHLAYHYPWFARLAQPPAAVLIENGRINRPMLSRHKISDDELMAHLRQNEVEDPSEVRRCLLEGDGRISVLKRSAGA